MRKKILITGGSGFLGKNLGLYLKLKNKYDVFLCSRNINNLKIAKNQTKCSVYPIDINNYASIVEAFSNIQPDIVVHSAAMKYVDLAEKFPEECIQTNVMGSINIFRVCKTFNIKKLIVISTDNVAHPEHNIYSLTKSLMEKTLLNPNNKSNFDITCLRLGHLCWSTDSVFNLWEQMTKKNNIVYTTGPNVRRYFISVDEVCSLIYFVLKNTNKLKGLVITQYMKSAMIEDILKIWSNYFNIKWKKVAKRNEDHIDEYLISPNELKNAYELNINGRKLVAIDPFNKKFNIFTKPLTSKNSIKHTKKEIEKLIINKPAIL